MAVVRRRSLSLADKVSWKNGGVAIPDFSPEVMV